MLSARKYETLIKVRTQVPTLLKLRQLGSYCPGCVVRSAEWLDPDPEKKYNHLQLGTLAGAAAVKLVARRAHRGLTGVRCTVPK